MISLEKWHILTPLQKLPNNVGNLGKLIVAKGFEKSHWKQPTLLLYTNAAKFFYLETLIYQAGVMTLLADQLLPTPEIPSSNTAINNFIYCQLYWND